uniref:Uncharacterized protein n=1 Tax=Glossina palpalis gambiensis TaxID=67801 RepID=A0A1B0BMD3_9MUSC
MEFQYSGDYNVTMKMHHLRCVIMKTLKQRKDNIITFLNRAGSDGWGEGADFLGRSRIYASVCYIILLIIRGMTSTIKQSAISTYRSIAKRRALVVVHGVDDDNNVFLHAYRLLLLVLLLSLLILIMILVPLQLYCY